MKRSAAIPIVLSVLALTGGCARPDAKKADSAASTSPGVAAAAPAWLQPVFRDMDRTLTDGQRDTLRATSLDSAFEYRSRLTSLVEKYAPQWQRIPAGDTLVAHGETLGTVQASILLDLYQQQLQRRALDLAGALHRMSPDYVYARYDRVALDSTLLHRDMDGSGVADRLVYEVKRTVVDGDTVNREGRLALYLDTDTTAAWNSGFDEFGAEPAREPFILTSGGSLIVVHASGGDADTFTIVDVHAGRARTVLYQQIDYGDGAFRVTDEGGSVIVTATKDVQLGDKTRTADISCSPKAWPGMVLRFDEQRREFIVERQVCVPSV